MKEKLNKSQSVSLLKKLTDAETVVNYKGDFVEMNVIGKLNQKKEQEINLKSIYELMTTFKTEVNQKFDSIDTRLSSLESEIKAVKADVKNLDAKVTALDGEIKTVKKDVISVKKDVKNLDIKLNKVIELNKDIINLNKLKVSKENKSWLFSNDGDDNTPTR